MKAILHNLMAALLPSLFLSLAAAPAFSQSTGSGGTAATAAPAPAAGTSPQTVHYHYHFHQYPNVPTAALMYPNYSTPNMTGAWNGYYPVPPSTAVPTQAQPYPPGYIPGPYAPLPFQNTAPNAPTAKGVIHVFLPTADATVYLNGQKMRGKGKDRRLVTDVLAMSREYQFWVTATFKENGESVTKYRKVDVGAANTPWPISPGQPRRTRSNFLLGQWIRIPWCPTTTTKCSN